MVWGQWKGQIEGRRRRCGGKGLISNDAPQEKKVPAAPDITNYKASNRQKKMLVDFKTKVVDLPLLCGKNIGQSGQRGLEVGFPDPCFELDIRICLGTNHPIFRYTKGDQKMKSKIN